ncbi:MAG: inverse autotransporter beta domain-containing protein [Opitutales bacterium]|nr:inverse autotransporter beta domain-containing protein [Opitutales bacterium]
MKCNKIKLWASFLLLSSAPFLSSQTVSNNGYLGGTIHGGKDTVIGEIDLFLPFHSSGNRIFYLAPKFSQADEGITNGGVGVGMRQVVPNEGMVLGAALFYDSLWSRRDEQYNQGGLYLEALHPWFELRGNYYLPESGENAFATRASDVFGTGNQILQNTEQRFEAALEGWDVSLGRAIALPEIPGQFYVEGSYRRYSNPFGSSVGGVGVALEYAPVSYLRIGAAYHEDKDFIGDRWFGSVRIEIPLGQETQDLRGGNGSRALMYAQVRRSTRVITSESDWIENPDGTPQVFLSNVLFVDNVDGGAGGDGTFENPFEEISTATLAAAVGETIYMRPGGGSYDGNVVLGESVSIIGNNPFELLYGGATASGNSVIDVTGTSAGITFSTTGLADSNNREFWIEGVDFVGSGAASFTVRVRDARSVDFSINDVNSVRFASFETNISSDAELNLLIRDSVFNDNSGPAQSTELQENDGTLNWVIENSFFNTVGPINTSGTGSTTLP